MQKMLCLTIVMISGLSLRADEQQAESAKNDAMTANVIMMPTPLVNLMVNSQAIIIDNQRTIMGNQERILKNQDTILANQGTILKRVTK